MVSLSLGGALHAGDATDAVVEKLAAAKPGDVVTVPAGIHAAVLQVPSGVTLQGEPGAVIDAQGKKSGINVVGAETKDVTIRGVEIRGAQYGMNLVKGAAGISIENCYVHDCDFGIWVRDCQSVSVTGCELAYNRNGVSFYGSKSCVVEGCDVHHNRVDGVLVTWGSEDVSVVGNTIHHHIAKGHPDGIQTYKNVRKLRIADNLIYESGQALHSQQTEDVVIENNVILGTLSQALVVGKGDTSNVVIRNNVVAYTGHIAINLTASDYEVFDNIIVTGGSKGALSYQKATNVTADRNTYWGTSRQAGTLLVIDPNGFHSNLKGYQSRSANDKNSTVAAPGFASAPVASSEIDRERIDGASAGSVPVTRANVFRVGDAIEIGFDGVQRHVTQIVGSTLSFDPPLAEKPVFPATILVWGDQPRGWDLGERFASIVQRMEEKSSEPAVTSTKAAP